MRILVILSRVPYPLEKGDKLRAYHQISRLARDHEIILCCLNDTRLHPDALKDLEPFCKEIIVIKLGIFRVWLNLLTALFSGKPLQIAYFYHKHAQRRIDQAIEQHIPKHIYCQLVRVAEYARKYSFLPKTIDYMDALSIGLQRRIDNAPFYLRPFLWLEGKRLRRYESEIFDSFTNHSIISAQDQVLIDHPKNKQIRIISNGVDTIFFNPQFTVQKDRDLVFTGNMNYPPNVESAVFLATKILPLVQQVRPEVTLLISGATPAAAVKALASANTEVTGWIDDIRTSYARSKVFVAPMLIGTGLQNKLLEAMAMGIPCITSHLANNALGAAPGKEIFIGSTPAQYADHILSLLRYDTLRNDMAKEGLHFVTRNFNWDTAAKQLNAMIMGDPY